MSIWAPPGIGDFAWSFSSIAGTQPAAALGASVTGTAANTKGSWVQLLSGANVSREALGILICANSLAVSSTALDALLDIGIDPAGGSSYTVLIPDLLVSCAGALGNAPGDGIRYYFPIRIPSGASVAARVAVNNASSRTVRVFARIFGSPRSPTPAGSYVTAFGVTSASSSGTAITSGTTSEGAWTAIASSIAKPHWFWTMGFGVNDSTMTLLGYHCDLGVGDVTNKDLLIENLLVNTSAQEECWYTARGRSKSVPAGANIYGRMQCSGTADSNLSLAAYGVGG